ncbi:MAG: class I SAM-dependent methyltransferase [Bacteroidales bacterium]
MEPTRPDAVDVPEDTSRLAGVMRPIVWRKLASLQRGSLVVNDLGARRAFGSADVDANAVAEVTIRDPRFYRQLVLGGTMGAAEAYIRGYWTSDDLVSLVRLFCRNDALASGFERGVARLARLPAAFAHRTRRNTAAGGRRNIAAHYDLGDDFFSLFLDETLAYSCAIFPSAESTLLEASVAKFDRICQKLELKGTDHVIEIGTGWGGFALHAAQHYGCRVTTTTISRRQYAFARRRVDAAGLGDRVTVLADDYRSLRGSYDKLVSIEMIEAVGHQYFDAFFRVCSDLLKPEGLMLLQAIVIPDQRFDRYKQSVDFIQRYIFPGGCLPSLGAICASVGRVSDLWPCDLEDITPHYAETLAHWRRRFTANLDEVRKLGFSEEFIRTWEFYFCYCEGGFRERVIGDVQMLFAKPLCRRAATLPLRGAARRGLVETSAS